MAKPKRKKDPTPFDIVREAVEKGGYPHTIEQQGDNMVVTIEVAPNVRTAAVFDRDGRAVPPPGVRELIEKAIGAVRPPAPHPEQPVPQEPFESVSYDVEKLGACTDEAPCQGLQVLMSASCVEHGGIVGMVNGDPEAKVPELIGFIPTPHHRRGHLLSFNFCPCCGRDYRGTMVLGSEGPSTIQ